MKRLCYALFAGILSLLAVQTSGQVLEPVKWAFTLEKQSGDTYLYRATATIDSGWHLYSTRLPEGNIAIPTAFVFEEAQGVALVGEVVEKSEVIEEIDQSIGEQTRYFVRTALFEQTLRITPPATSVKGYVEFMACDDEQCIPPAEAEFELSTAGSGALTADVEAGKEASGGSIWGIILEAILWGFAALLTPCVFPMVPMTVSFFLKGADQKGKSRLMASVYGLSIVLLYTLPIAIIIMGTYIFGGESVTADIFNWLSTHWIPNLLFFVIFMVFAASFFGAFEIVLPSSLVNKADSKADKGGLLGAFFMALTLVLVSFSCTGPIVGTIIVKSTQGEIWEPIITMLAFSIAFALPFTLFAIFPSWLKKLPKSGGWLNSVKVVLGFVEVALGFKFLSVADQVYHWNLLDREVYIAIWIVCFTLLGFYLLGKLRFKHDSESTHISVMRLALSMVSFVFVVYMIPGMWGAPLKALSGYLPPLQTMDFDLSRMIRENSGQGVGAQSTSATVTYEGACEKPKYADFLHLPHGLQGYFDYDQAVQCAREQNKPIFIDFTGHGCVNCREMEANVWGDPRVLRILREEYVVVALYVDDKTTMPESDWVVSRRDGKVKKTIGKKYADFQVDQYNVNAQPYYVLMGRDATPLVTPRAYNLDVEGFIDFLNAGLEAYKKSAE